MVSISPTPKLQFFDANGDPLVGGKLTTYQAGTVVKLTTYTDSTRGTPNTNPIILGSLGEADVWLDPVPHKYVLTTSTDGAVWTVDNITSNQIVNASAYELGSDAAAADHTGVVTGHVIQTNYIDSNRTAGSGSEVAHTGVTTLANAGNWPLLADGLFYDVAGLAFKDLAPNADFLKYGAIGDGSTDDTTAIQSAFNSGKDVYIPTPVSYYKITAQLTFPDRDNFAITGDGATSIIQQATALANGIRNNTGNRHFSYTFRDFVIRMADSTLGGVGIDLEDISDSFFSNVNVATDAVTDGFRTAWRVYSSTGLGALRNEFEGCRGRTEDHASAVALLFAGDSAQSANSNHWRGGTLRADSGKAVHMPDNGGGTDGHSNQNVIAFTSFEGTSLIGVDVDGGRSNLFMGNRFEGVTTAFDFDSETIDNMTLMNFITSGVTPYSKGGENAYWDFQSHASVDNIMDLVRGHYQVSNLRDTAVAGFHGSLTNAAFPVFGARIDADTVLRYEVRADGQVEWGPGDGVSDVTLRRSATALMELFAGSWDMNSGLIIDGGASGPTVKAASGTPESAISAPIGSIFARTNGGLGTSAYIKSVGSGNTGWKGIATSDGGSGGSASAGSGNQYIEIEINGSVYKVLHDGTV